MNTKKPPLPPAKPGVYLFKDAIKNIIYIGKALSLKNRVSSYFSHKQRDWKTAQLLNEYASLDYIITRNEPEALLLEAELIQKYQPHYNVLLKNGQPFLYINFTQDNLPLMLLTRNKAKIGFYFGPFLHKTATRSAYHFLKKTFQLIICNKTIADGCLDFHLGICSGSCMPNWNKNDYLFRLGLAQDVLKNNPTSFLKKINIKVQNYNTELSFEKSKNLLEYAHNMDAIFADLNTKLHSTKLRHQISAATQPPHIDIKNSENSAYTLQTILKTEKPIYTIDCFDISHFQSSYIVGACVRFVNGKPDSNNFRRFNIRSIKRQNDYAALQEIVARRYKSPNDVPDLILIDGGKGQLSAIQAIIPLVNIAALAKREETLFSANIPRGLKLNTQEKHALLLIALRDYTHHFAISHHRYKRKNSFL